MIIEAKGDSLLTLDAFEEMLEVFERISEMMSEDDDVCAPFYLTQRKGEKECARFPTPLDFIYDAETDTYDLAKYKTD